MSRLRPITAAQRGVTLVELMITIGVAGILTSVITSSVMSQQRNFHLQMDLVEAHQNGRAALDFLRFQLRQAGWGMVIGREPQTFGVAPVDPCFEGVCDGHDQVGGSDRLQVNYAISSDFISANPYDAPPGSIRVRSPDANYEVLEPGDLALISGHCLNATGSKGEMVATDVVTITGATQANLDVSYTFDGAFSCANGYAAGFNFGEARQLDFWIDRSELTHPVLMMTEQNQNIEIARDIDDLQIQFGINDAADMAFGIDAGDWCDDPSGVAEACNAFPLATNTARTVAVRIALVTRTTSFRHELDTRRPASLTIQNNTRDDTSDGYRRYIYRSTIALRNYAP